MGQGNPVLILHGLFGLSDNWVNIGKALAEQHQVFILDARNHGRSPHIQKFDYPSMVEDIYEFLTDFRLRRIILVGHSMGGMTAMNFALEYPHRVDQLIIVDIAPKVYPVIHEKIFDALRSVDLNSVRRRSDADGHLSQMIPEKSTRQFLLKNLLRGEDGRYQWRLNLEVIYQNMDKIRSGIYSQNARFENPVLFIAGSESDYIKDEDTTKIHDRFPNSEIITIPGASHWVHYDKPQALLQLIQARLSEGENPNIDIR
jgi:pimeloyl-ACP methyl ester carboxylesterase